MNQDSLDLRGSRDFVDKGLPRRLSARKGDPHYDGRAEALSDKVDVILDGEVLAEVTSCDVDIGRIERRARGENGQLILDRGVPTFETSYGHVEVRWRRKVHG